MPEIAAVPAETPAPKDRRALIAVDLGAESCRVSLLRWVSGEPAITLVHRFGNAPRIGEDGLRWGLATIEAGLEDGLRQCATIASEGVRSIAVDGWAVDYVRLDRQGNALADPFCYRDERTVEAERSLHRTIPASRIRELTGVQQLRINTLYQLHADALAGSEPAPWLNLPEYILSRWGAERVAELTNATHSQLIDLRSNTWSPELFRAAGAEIACAGRLVPPGTFVGKLAGPLTGLSAFRDTVLIAPACHDTASAIAGIPAQGDDWAYISSGTWSLVGTLLDEPLNDRASSLENFTNLAAIGGKICFHKSVNGLWLLRQCLLTWEEQGARWTVEALTAAAAQVPRPAGLLEVDDPELLLPGNMPLRINAQRESMGLKPLDVRPENAPAFASLIFHSLAARYAAVLRSVASHSGKDLKRLFLVGGASRNAFLNRLVQEATSLEIVRGASESSLLGNFAVQLAALEDEADRTGGVTLRSVNDWACRLAAVAANAPLYR
jgi:rhamnulokinase